MAMTLFGIQRDTRDNRPPKQAPNSGGRWHTGSQMVRYLSESPALAILEFLKGKMTMLNESEFSHSNFLLTSWTLNIDPAAMPSTNPSDLPLGWQHIPYRHSLATQRLGNAWLASNQSLALRVPCATLPLGMGWNVLLNLAHPDFPTPVPAGCVTATPFELPFYLGVHQALKPK